MVCECCCCAEVLHGRRRTKSGRVRLNLLDLTVATVVVVVGVVGVGGYACVRACVRLLVCYSAHVRTISIGVADVEDLELVTKEDLIDLGFNDEDANRMMDAIAEIA